MKHYRAYMDRQQVRGDLHDRLIHLEPPRKTRRTVRYAALAACCALLIAVGAWQAGAAKDRSAAEEIASDIPVTAGEDGAAIDIGQTENADMTFLIPALNYADGIAETAADFALPEGCFTRALDRAAVCRLLWGGEASEEVPWQLGWGGYSLKATAWYDGYGELWQVTLTGEGGGDTFEITLAPDGLPPACLGEGGRETEVKGVTVTAGKAHYDCNGDGAKEYLYAASFVANGVGARCRFQTGEQSQLCELFVQWATLPEGGLSLDHLRTVDDAPAFRSETFDSLAAVRSEAEYAPYLPDTDPAGYGEFYAHLTWQEGVQNELFLRWSRGYDDVCLWITRPEGDAPVAGSDPVDVDARDTWDLRLYSDVWEEASGDDLDTLLCPTFRAGDMTRDILDGRAREKDTGGWEYSFCILHGDGTVVEYRCSGLTADKVWEMVKLNQK